jgi:hypothetical protein
MGMNRPGFGQHIALPDHLAAGQGDQLRITLLDIVENERPGQFQRRRFLEGQIAPFPRDNIEGLMKTLDALLEQFRPRPSSRQRVGPAPRGIPGKHLCCTHPSDNGLI